MTFKKVIFKNQKLSHNLYILTFFMLFVFAPDLVLKYVCGLPVSVELLFFFGALLFGFLLSATNKVVFMFFMVLIFVIQLIELNFTAYFGTPIEPSNIINIFREAKDVFDPAYLKNVWFITPALLGLMVATCVAFWCSKPLKIPLVWLVLFYMAAHKPYRAYTQSKDVWYFQPAITRPSLKNAISTFSYFVFQYWPKGYQNLEISYIPYALEPKHSDVENILLVWGESLYAGHLPMYGYSRNTFPKMAQLLENQNWQVVLGLSNGIATATSTLLFFNTAREPANAAVLKTHIADLFKAAKENGFHTYYLSNQESRLTMGFSVSSIDELMTNDLNPLYFAKHKDEGLTKLLLKKGLKGTKNFVVLHMRSPHSPYENRYEGREAEFEKYTPAAEAKDRFTYEVNTYDNALLYTDMVLFDMVSAFEKLADSTNYSIYITADHGQLFNYHNMWGHNNLVLEQAKVPVFIKKANGTKLPNPLAHYELAKLILQDLGYTLINKNETPDVYYLHGNNVDFPYDFIEYRIGSEGAHELKKENTANLKNRAF
ncbi:MAG: sulfatase-like hydrolase/transferase [Alphaproteobacteria bacterium]|nr:sulfatase-like hydrolase/transferase [Alphaproteobacteria bacterium]